MVRITRWTKATPSCLLFNFRTAEVCSQANSSPWNVNGCQLTRRDGELCDSCTQHTAVTFHNHYTAVSHSLCITSNTQIRVVTVWVHNMKCSTDQGIFGKGKDDSWSMQQVIRWVLEHSSPSPPPSLPLPPNSWGIYIVWGWFWSYFRKHFGPQKVTHLFAHLNSKF